MNTTKTTQEIELKELVKKLINLPTSGQLWTCRYLIGVALASSSDYATPEDKIFHEKFKHHLKNAIERES